jgi:hypothetical protein
MLVEIKKLIFLIYLLCQLLVFDTEDAILNNYIVKIECQMRYTVTLIHANNLS